MVHHKDINRIRREAIGESMKAQFKVGDLVIEAVASIWQISGARVASTDPRKGMVYKVTTGAKGRQWYEVQFFGSGETVEWVDSYAHKYLEHYKAEDNESKDI
jgi:exopolyphosphatase/pppGpp-phosphohydrolase